MASLLGRLSLRPGPLLTKELLVGSRRARYYLLRFAYAAVLGLFIALIWLAFIQSVEGRSAMWRTRNMPKVGMGIVSSIVCFQFGAAQLVAVVLLSSAISEEIYGRTLVPILTTPISMWQVVMGKFLGRLVHVGLLLALSIPLLAMVRVLGGVPWGYLLAGVCITVTASMFAASVAMFYSVLCRRAYLAILAAGGSLVVLYGALAMLLGIVATVVGFAVGGQGMAVVLYPNPVAAMVYETVVLMDPSAAVGGFYWPLHCLLMLAATGGMLKACEALVRRSAVRKALGFQAGAATSRGPVVAVRLAGGAVPVLSPVGAGPAGAGGAEAAPVVPVAWRPAPPGRGARPARTARREDEPKRRRFFRGRGWNIRRMIVSPIFWRELRKPLLRDKVVQTVAMCAVVFYLLYTYAILGASDALGTPLTQGFFAGMFLLAGMLCTAMDSATTIAPEKQAQTWPALLSTPVSDWHILLGKAGGTLFRCLPVWLLFVGHSVLFASLGMLHPLALPQLLLAAVASCLFLTASGVFFSVRLGRATSAVLANIGLGGLLWVLLPFGAALVGEIYGDREMAELLQDLNPVTQVSVVAAGAARWAGGSSGRVFHWPSDRADLPGTTWRVLGSFCLYALAALGFLLRARRLLRRNAFQR